MNQVFKRLQQHHMKLKMKKCTFIQSEMSYLGFKISAKGIASNLEKVKAISKMSAPTTMKGCHSLLGLISAYRMFIPKFSEIADPIIKLKKNIYFIGQTRVNTHVIN